MLWALPGKGDKPQVVVLRVRNGKDDKPTIMWYNGCGNGIDGSSNFNFVKELLHRYSGGELHNVFIKPELKAEPKLKVDQGSFCCILTQIAD